MSCTAHIRSQSLPRRNSIAEAAAAAAATTADVVVVRFFFALLFGRRLSGIIFLGFFPF